MPIKYVVNGKGYIVPEEQVQNFLDGVKQQGLRATKVGDDYSKPITSTDGVRLITVGDKGYAVPESQVQRFKEVASSLNKDFVDRTEEHRKSRQKLIDATLQAAEESYQGKNEKSGDRSLAMLKKTIYGWNDNDILDMYETYRGVIDESTPWGTTLARMRSLAPGKEKMGTDKFNFNRIGHRLFLAFEKIAAFPEMFAADIRSLTDKPLTEKQKFLRNYLNERERLTSDGRGFMESAMAALAESIPTMVLAYTSIGLGAPIAGTGFLTKAWGKAVLKNVAKLGLAHGLTTMPQTFVSESIQYDLDKKKLTTGDAVNILLKTGTEVLTETIGDAIFGVTVGKIAAGTVGRKIEKALLDKPVKKMFTDALKVAGANFVTEGFIEEGTNTILNAATDMLTGRPDAWKNFYSNFMEAALLGGVSTLPLSLLGVGGASVNVRGIKRVYNAVNEYANIAEETIPDLDPAKQLKVILSKRLRAGVEIAKNAQERFDKNEITQAELDAEQTKASDIIGQVISEINIRAELSKMDPRYSFDGELQHMLMIASLTHDTLANSSPAVEKHIEETNAQKRGRIMPTSEAMEMPDTPESLTADIEAETQRLENPTPQAQPETVDANPEEVTPVEQPTPAMETTGDTELDQIIADNFDDVAIEKINSGQATVEEIEREAVYARKAIRQILSLKERNPQNKKAYNRAIKSFTSLLGELSAAHNAITGGIVDLAEPLRLEQEQKRQAYNEGKSPKPVQPEPEKPKRVRVTKAKASTEPTIDEVPDQKDKAMQDRIAELEARLKALENPEPTPPAPRKKGKIGKVQIITSDKTSAKNVEPVPDVSKETILERGADAVGDETYIVTLDNKQVKMRWAIIDLKNLTGSHNADFTENPDYPKGKGYQPKKRDAQNYRIQVAKIVNEFNPSLLMDSTRSREGAPIIVQEDGKNVVLSGNGRVIALNQLSENNSYKLGEYTDYILENATDLGLDLSTEDIAAMDEPILVRVLSEDAGISPKELADDSNTQDTSSLTPYEQAISDAANMTEDMISDLFVDANNEIVTVSNMPFITAFVNQNIPQTEHNTYIPKGVLTVQLVQRIKKALIVKAFGESAETQAIVDQLDSTKPDAKNILGAVVSLTPLMVKINSQINAGNLYPLGMTDELLHATLRSLRLAAEGISYKQYLEQETVFDESGDEFSNELFDFLQTTKGKKSEMLWTMSEHYRVIKEFGNPSEQDIFGYKREATKSDVFAIAKEHYNEAKGKKQTEIDLTGEGTDQGADQNTPPTPQERYRQLSGNPAQPTIEIGQMTDAILSLLPKQTRPTAVIAGNTATITISYRGQPKQIVINSLTGRITDMDGKPIYSGRTSVNRDEASSVMAIIDIVKNDNEGNMTAYHEGFHLAFALFLSEKEQRTLIETYSQGKKLADMTQDEIIAAEERAAKQFEALIRGDMLPAGAQRTLIEKLWDAIKTFVRKLFGNDFAINHLDVLTRIKNADYLSGLGNSKPVFGKRYLVSQESVESERQLDEVRAKYEGTDKWMKAPNGKPTKLNERQWLQVRTPAFKAWFGDWENDPENASKVVDENGEPMVVYHGTDATKPITRFKDAVGRRNEFHFGTAKQAGIRAPYGHIGEYFLNLRNIKRTTDKKDGHDIEAKRAIKEGYDGLVYANIWERENFWYDDIDDSYVAFSPSQIKSATANVGTFDPQNPDIRYKTAEEPMDEQAMLEANETVRKIMDSGVEMSATLKGFMVKVINVMSANSGESQKEKLNLLIKSFHKYLKVALPEMGFTKSTVLHITTRFGNIKTIRSFAKEAAALDKMINQAYGKKLYAAILASARSVANDKVALRSTKQPTTDKLAQEQVKYISQVIAMSPEMQSAEYQRLETVDPGTEMSPEESDMLEFKKWAVMLFSGLRLDHVAKDGSVRHSYADPAKIAQAYHELQSLIKNGKTLQAEKMAKITAEFNQTRFKIKAMLLGGSGDLTDFDRQDIESGRKKSLTRWADALHAQLAFMETIFEEADVLGYRNHKSLIAYKAKLEQGIADLALSIEEEPTDKKKLQLIDLKNSMEALDSMIAETATYKGIYKGWFQTTFYDDLYDAKSRFEGGLISYMNGLDEKRKQIAAKVGLDRFWHSYGTAAMNELKYKIDMKDSDGTRQLRTLNMQQIMAVYAQSLNPEMGETVEGSGFDETAMADINRILDGSDVGRFARLWVEYIVHEFMPTYYNTINAIHVERYGFDLQQEMIYFPIERKYNKDVKMPEPGDYRPVMSESMYVGNTSLIARVNSTLPMNLERSVFDAQLVTHIHNMEHFKAFAMPMYRARMTMLKRDVQQAFIDKLGKQRWDTLTGFYRDQAANGYTQINKTTVSNVANWMMNSSAFIFLNLKPSVGLKQTSSMILMAGYMKPLQAVVNYAWAFKNIDKVWKIIKDSPTFQIRYKQGITAEQHMALQHGNSSTVKSLLRQYVNDYINFGKYGDLVSVLIGGGAYYKQQYDEIRKSSKEMSEDAVEAEAIKQMEKMVERTQQSASILYASRIRRDSMLGRAVTQFQTQFHALYNAIYNRINELRVEGADKGQIAWSLAMLTMLYPMLAAFFDDGLVPPDDPRDVAMGVVSQNMAMIPVMGNMIDTMLTAVVTGNYRQDYTRIMPSSSLFEVAFKFMQNANQFVDEPTFRKGFETSARAMILFGIPAYPLWQTTYGMIDFFSGKDKRAGRLFGFSEGQLDMVEKENKANDKRLDKK